MRCIRFSCHYLLCLLIIGGAAQAAELELFSQESAFAPAEVNGFLEARAGRRLQSDPYEKGISVMETRAQIELFTYTEQLDFKFKGDLWLDGVTEQGESDIREAWMFSRPNDFLDLKVGRQVLTWGTGDLVFLNDLFPKDWQSYFIGRDSEYLKAPSDAVKVTFFSTFAGLDLIYTPRFNPDRYITGEYISYWDANNGSYAGQNDIVNTEQFDSWFKDDELALRLYSSFGNYEVALYNYWGHWKQPGGKNSFGDYIFPRLHVYGSSIRGQIVGGIGNIELAYYDSADDLDGEDLLIDNSQMRYVIGYSRDLAMNLNASMQYYVEQLLDYGAHKESHRGTKLNDEFRRLITLQLTKLLMNQNLELSFSGYYSPSDEDAYLRPKVSYHFSDNLICETGANLFMGSKDYTFFGQFENNSNVYAAVRYSL